MWFQNLYGRQVEGEKNFKSPMCVGGVRVAKETGLPDIVSGNSEVQISVYSTPFVEKMGKTIGMCLFLYNRFLEGYPRIWLVFLGWELRGRGDLRN